MGILNVTPDSFYDGGRHTTLHLAVRRAVQMVDEGADIIDVGGEKAGPGAPVPVEEEIRRVVPLIKELRREVPLPISIDTFKPETARAAVEAGAEIINSIDGFRDPAMRGVAAASEACVVIMHIQGWPRVHQPDPRYADVVEEVRNLLQRQAELCIEEGIATSRIIVDPGPGFGKSSAHDLALLRNLSCFTDLPYPVLLAASRKRFIGDVLGLGVEERLEGSLAVIAWGVLNGIRLVRAHDIRASVRVCRMTEAVLDPDPVLAR